MGARSALGESPALQAYLAARYVALSVDAGATSDARLTTRAYEIQQLMTDLFIRPSASTQREVRL